MTRTAAGKHRSTEEDVHRILDGPLELIIEGAEAYWLEGDAGQPIPPESSRSLAPLLLALGLVREGRDPDTLTLYARLAHDERFRICGGIGLVAKAEHAAGIPRRPRDRDDVPRVNDATMRRVAVDPIAWRKDAETRGVSVIEAVSALNDVRSVTRETPPRATAAGPHGVSIEEFGRMLGEPKELVLDGAEAYWLEDHDGHRIGPESDRSLAPLFLSLGLAREGRDPDTLFLCARLTSGERFEIGGGPSLIGVAEHAAGVPRRSR
jgi:hypothetical protein